MSIQQLVLSDYRLLLHCHWGLHFWDVMQHWLVVGYQHYGTAC